MATDRRNLAPWHSPYDPRFAETPAMKRAQHLFLLCLGLYLAALAGCLYLTFHLTHR